MPLAGAARGCRKTKRIYREPSLYNQSFWELLGAIIRVLRVFASFWEPGFSSVPSDGDGVPRRQARALPCWPCTRQPNTLPRAGCRLLLRSEVRCSHSAFPTTLAATALAAGSAAFAFTDAAARDAAAPLRAAALTAAVSALVAADHAPALLRPDALQAFV